MTLLVKVHACIVHFRVVTMSETVASNKANGMAGSVNTRVWMTLRGQSDYGWRLLSSRGGWLTVGGKAEAQVDTPLDIKEPLVPGAIRRRGKRWRIVGVFHHGWSLIFVTLSDH